MKLSDVNIEQLSPMMQHYASIKKEYPDCLIMYRLGDFYELFFEDAVLASNALELALTARECGLEDKAPMAGIPHFALDNYASKLVEQGFKLAIVEQVEDPALAKGLVKRRVTRIITPGTLTDMDSLNQKENNFLCALYFDKQSVGLALADISTGQIKALQKNNLEDQEAFIYDWVTKIKPSEVLLLGDEQIDLLEKLNVFTSVVKDFSLYISDLNRKIDQLLSKKKTIKLKKHPLAMIALVGLFDYIYQFQEEKLEHFNHFEWIEEDHYLHISPASRMNLELERNLQDFTKKNSLLSCLDQTKTAMGSRLLQEWLEFPLLEKKKIEERLDLVEIFHNDLLLLTKLRESLAHVYDLERLVGKFAYQKGNARDLLSLSYSLSRLPYFKNLLKKTNLQPLIALEKNIDACEDLCQLIDRALVDDPPLSLKEGGLIRKGFSQELDNLKGDSEKAREELISYESEERERTQIKNYRIIYRKNAGYFIEITNSNLDKVPNDYQRKQTLKNAERFVTEKLQHLEARILGDESKIFDMEYRIFQDLREKIMQEALRIQNTANLLAYLDCLLSFAKVAGDYNYVRPLFTMEDKIHILAGRHPIVERNVKETFIANDLEIGNKDNRIHIITGPNMAGKSTYMRQNALIMIMAQMGSFVPCEKCILPITDQIFTRIGASDNLARGESTFMVEMKEMADILKHASKNSFLLLDEVGRGTSTSDGLSIAYAIIEYLSDRLQAKTLFATHYHELTILEDEKDNIQNKKMAIARQDDELIFLRKILPGKADQSYGIEVAKLSGLPEQVLSRAYYLLENLDDFNNKEEERLPRQKDFHDYQKENFIHQLAHMDINQLTPVDSLITLSKIIEEAKDLL